MAVDKTKTWNIPEHSGTSRNTKKKKKKKIKRQKRNEIK